MNTKCIYEIDKITKPSFLAEIISQRELSFVNFMNYPLMFIISNEEIHEISNTDCNKMWYKHFA